MDNNTQDTTKKTKSNLREFFLSTISVKNATSVFLLTFMIFLFGIQSYNTMPKEQFPEISVPTIFINTPYPGNSALDIENLITRELEKEIQSVEGLKEMTSSSVQDFSIVIAEFNIDQDLDDALRKVKDAVDRAASELPTDLPTEPVVEDINLSEIPIMTVNLAGEYSVDALKEYADILKDEIEVLDEISEANIKGDQEREMKVNVDLYKMQSLEISFQDIENAITSENLTMSGGEIVNNKFRRAIRVIGEFDNAAELGDLIVKNENQNTVFLEDIADVSFGYKDRTSIARADGLPVISLDIIKRSGENLLEASDKIKKIVDEAELNKFPDGLQVSIFNDQSVNTRREVNNLENSIISGVILVVLVLLFFLGLRNALFVGIAIPLSMLLGIMIIYLSGVTLNMVVLFALILALGMLVDNGIVIVENIYRYMQEGYNGDEAARYGAGEVAVAIIASTATTLAAFFPLLFWPSLMGEFMQYLPITLIAVLTSSLFVALVINPVLTASFMKVDREANSEKVKRRKKRNVLYASGVFLIFAIVGQLINQEWLRNISIVAMLISLLNIYLLRPGSFYFQEKVIPWMEKWYNKFVTSSLIGRRPVIVFFSTVLLLIASVILLMIRTPKVVFFPETEPQYINAFVELPIGTDIERTNEVVNMLEGRIENTIKDDREIVESVLTQIGENTADPSGPPEPGATPNAARITVSFVPSSERNGKSTFRIMEDIRKAVHGLPGVNVVVDQNQNGPPTGKPINLEIQGDDIDRLVMLSEDMMDYMKGLNIPGIEELQKDVKIGKPELLVNVDRDAARRYGLSTFSIANTIRTSIYGKDVSTFKKGEDDYDVFIRLQDKYKNNVNDVLNQSVTFRNNQGQIVQVPISAVADIEYSSTYSSIKRKDQQRMITVYSNVLDGYNANEIVADLEAELQSYEMPEGYSWKFTGEQEEQAQASEFLGTALLIAIFAIFIIIVAQFNSIISPFIILLSVLFSTIGVFLGISVAGTDIVIVMTGVGIISLAGIVVNNAIVLIDYIDLTIKRKREELGLKDGTLPYELVREAIIEAGGTRLRPVLLTAITTILGLIPLAIGLNIDFFGLITDTDPNFFIGGESADFWSSMAWTVIYGLTFATFLTLIVVPVMYWLAYRLKYKFIAWRGGETPKDLN